MPIDNSLKFAYDTAQNYLDSLAERRAFPDRDALDNLNALDLPLSDEQHSAQQTLNLLHRYGSPATATTNGPRHFGMVMGASLPAAIAANWLATAWDQNAALHDTSPVSAKLEEIALKWTLSLLRLPATCAGGFVTGTSEAHIAALTAARNDVLQRVGWDAEADGLIGAPPVNVIVSEDIHVTLLKALNIVGLGRKRIIKVPVDNQGRMIAEQIPQTTGPTIICCQVGNVNSGAFDPVTEICEVARKTGAWVHVDGAFGLWARAVPQKEELCRGIELADSWSVDFHKWLNVPYDNGLVIVKKSEALSQAMQLSASYLPPSEHRDPSQFVPELSRKARGADVWAAIYSLGRKGIAEMINTTCELASLFATRLNEAGCEILNDVVINQVLVSFGSEEKTRHVIRRLQEQGLCWFGGTVWQGTFAMRISVSSCKTSADDVEKVVAHIIEIYKSN